MSRRADGQKSGFIAVAPAILLFFCLICAALLPSRAVALETHDYKMAGEAMHISVVMYFGQVPEPRWLLLRYPHRLAIDLPKTKFAIDRKELKARGLVRNVCYGHVNDK